MNLLTLPLSFPVSIMFTCVPGKHDVIQNLYTFEPGKFHKKKHESLLLCAHIFPYIFMLCDIQIYFIEKIVSVLSASRLTSDYFLSVVDSMDKIKNATDMSGKCDIRLIYSNEALKKMHITHMFQSKYKIN